jgi:hypothetical protein
MIDEMVPDLVNDDIIMVGNHLFSQLGLGKVICVKSADGNRRLRSSILPFAVGMVASKGMDRLSTFLGSWQESGRVCFLRGFLKTTNSVLVAASSCAFSGR